MAKLQNTSLVIDWLVESTQPVPVNDPSLQRLVAGLQKVNNSLELSEFLFALIPATTNFNYRITLKDGRLWRQTIGAGLDPEMDFTVTHYWRESEFSQLRAARDAAIDLRQKYGVTRVRCTWP